MLLVKVRPVDIEQSYADAKVSAWTLTLHHTILDQAFRKAAKDRLIATNVAADLDGKPPRTPTRPLRRPEACLVSIRGHLPFHDSEEIGPVMLARIAKHTGLIPRDLQGPR